VKVNVGIFKIVGCRKKNVEVQDEEAFFLSCPLANNQLNL